MRCAGCGYIRSIKNFYPVTIRVFNECDAFHRAIVEAFLKRNV
ncbi:hypothetical protein MGSAQ_002431 [marine sediment metagenome]|uniref:Uncharacterized protein n=1 Tax=marine sediment metagenome TaxID=412755 RepID=A0A1B6NRS7_9ZZZZ